MQALQRSIHERNVLDTLLLAHYGISCHLMSSYAGFRYQANFVTAHEVMTALPL